MDEQPEKKDETYSIIFRALKHPVRRKILSILSEKDLAFTDLEKILGIDSGHLNYHLTSLDYLVSKKEDGRYQLSVFGKAALDLFSSVEGAPGRFGAARPTSILRRMRVLAIVTILIVSALSLGFYFQSIVPHNVEQTRFTSTLEQSPIWDYRIEEVQRFQSTIEVGPHTTPSFNFTKKNAVPGMLIVEALPSNPAYLDAVGIAISYPYGLQSSSIGVWRDVHNVIDNGTYTVQFYVGDAFPSSQTSIQVWVQIELLEIQPIG